MTTRVYPIHVHLDSADDLGLSLHTESTPTLEIGGVAAVFFQDRAAVAAKLRELADRIDGGVGEAPA